MVMRSFDGSEIPDAPATRAVWGRGQSRRWNARAQRLRRRLLQVVLAVIAATLHVAHPAVALATAPLPSSVRPRLLADVPRCLLELPQDDWLGPGFDLAKVTVQGRGHEVELNMMLDSALTTSMLMPDVAKHLGLGTDQSNTTERSFMAADTWRRNAMVNLEGARLAGTELDLGSFRPLVTSFMQHQIGKQLGCPVHGMLGMEFYERFAVEMTQHRLRLHEPDSAEELAKLQCMDQLTMSPLRAQLLGVYVDVAGNDLVTAVPKRAIGIIDTGASHTVLNWAAAKSLLSLDRDDPKLLSMDSISAYDIGGEPIDMPLVEAHLQLRGSGRLPHGSASFAPVEVGIGDIALFKQLLLGEASKPAALIGQDLLVQRPMLLAGRQRLLCFGKTT